MIPHSEPFPIGWETLFVTQPTAEIVESLAAASWWRDEIAADPALHHPKLSSILDEVVAGAECELARRRACPPPRPDLVTNLDLIKSRIDVAGYLTHRFGTNFCPRGNGELVTHCVFPDHEDPDPSLQVNLAKRLWHCFGCGRGADIFSLLMLLDNLSFRQAVDALRGEVGLRVPQSTDRRPAGGLRTREARPILRTREVHHG